MKPSNWIGVSSSGLVPSNTEVSGLFKAGKVTGKRKKDPNAPKKASTAYMLWLNANRDIIKETLADEGVELEGRAKVTEVAKRAGAFFEVIFNVCKSRMGGFGAGTPQLSQYHV